MSLIVQKFGGTSVADSEKILAAARKAIRAQQQGHKVVMVLSAMGKNTDGLLELAGQITEKPSARELDMLLATGEQVSVALMAMAIHELGSSAVSLTGTQIGITTDSSHTKARILSISTQRVRRILDEGNIVIAAGFQGVDEDLNITTLGRGGSDTTAVALAAVLGASMCEIYTDVDAVYSTDPRVLPEATRTRRISYDEMLELASLGAGVMHSRSIEFAKKFSVPIHVRSSFSDIPGTMIVEEGEEPTRAVCGATLTKDEARITVVGVPDIPGSSLEIFSRIADRGATVDMIVQNVGEEGRADVSFTVPRNELQVTLEAARGAAAVTGAREVTHDENVSKVSVVGRGMARQSGVADRVFRALAEAGVNIQMITTSEIKISVLVARDDALLALRTVHNAFDLHKTPLSVGDENAPLPSQARSSSAEDDAAQVIERLRDVGMEGLTIDDIALDVSQGRVTIHDVPDEPGVAARVFEEIAAADIFVDMIVQSHGHDGLADLGLTVPRDQVDRVAEVAERNAEKFRCSGISTSPDVAKLSVSGIGLRSHTDVAIRMFRSLAAAGINVEMVNTSEVRVNVIVDGKLGEQGLDCLQQAFADAMR